MTSTYTLNTSIVQSLLEIEAIRLKPGDPFIWSSGLRAPIYCDNRLTLSHPKVRDEVLNGFIHLLEKHDLKPNAIAGVATGGIPYATLLADRLDLPLAYVRGEQKAHGRQNRIEGELAEGANVTVIEDLISTGGSAISAAKAVQETGCKVLSICAIFSYDLQSAVDNFSDAGFDLFTLTDFGALLKEADRKGYLGSKEIEVLRKWQTDPQGWSNARVSPSL